MNDIAKKKLEYALVNLRSQISDGLREGLGLFTSNFNNEIKKIVDTLNLQELDAKTLDDNFNKSDVIQKEFLLELASRFDLVRVVKNHIDFTSSNMIRSRYLSRIRDNLKNEDIDVLMGMFNIEPSCNKAQELVSLGYEFTYEELMEIGDNLQGFTIDFIIDNNLVERPSFEEIKKLLSSGNSPELLDASLESNRTDKQEIINFAITSKVQTLVTRLKKYFTKNLESNADYLLETFSLREQKSRKAILQMFCKKPKQWCLPYYEALSQYRLGDQQKLLLLKSICKIDFSLNKSLIKFFNENLVILGRDHSNLIDKHLPLINESVVSISLAKKPKADNVYLIGYLLAQGLNVTDNVFSSLLSYDGFMDAYVFKDLCLYIIADNRLHLRDEILSEKQYKTNAPINTLEIDNFQKLTAEVIRMLLSKDTIITNENHKKNFITDHSVFIYNDDLVIIPADNFDLKELQIYISAIRERSSFSDIILTGMLMLSKEQVLESYIKGLAFTLSDENLIRIYANKISDKAACDLINSHELLQGSELNEISKLSNLKNKKFTEKYSHLIPNIMAVSDASEFKKLRYFIENNNIQEGNELFVAQDSLSETRNENSDISLSLPDLQKLLIIDKAQTTTIMEIIFSNFSPTNFIASFAYADSMKLVDYFTHSNDIDKFSDDVYLQCVFSIALGASYHNYNAVIDACSKRHPDKFKNSLLSIVNDEKVQRYDYESVFSMFLCFFDKEEIINTVSLIDDFSEYKQKYLRQCMAERLRDLGMESQAQLYQPSTAT